MSEKEAIKIPIDINETLQDYIDAAKDTKTRLFYIGIKLFSEKGYNNVA